MHRISSITNLKFCSPEIPSVNKQAIILLFLLIYCVTLLKGGNVVTGHLNSKLMLTIVIENRTSFSCQINRRHHRRYRWRLDPKRC